jgi:hypothetical protein
VSVPFTLLLEQPLSVSWLFAIAYVQLTPVRSASSDVVQSLFDIGHVYMPVQVCMPEKLSVDPDAVHE